MRIGDRQIGSSDRPYVIAEIGVNHDGSPSRAVELVAAAAGAGADAVKFQYFRAADLLSRAARLANYQQQAAPGGADDPLAMLQPLELPIDALAMAAVAARALGLHAIVTVFSVPHMSDVDATTWDALKTASPDIINRPLIQAMMGVGLPMLVSCGAATIDEIETVTAWLDRHPHALMQCVSAYPTPDDRAAITARLDMARVNPNAIGYSDHTSAIDTGALAVASGALILEKHLTHDRHAPGPDHAMSLDPAQFRKYVDQAHRAWRMLGPCRKDVLSIERDVREVSRQSLTTARSLPAGHVLSRGDLTIKRPGTGLSPARLEEVIGHRLTRTVEADQPLQAGDVETPPAALPQARLATAHR